MESLDEALEGARASDWSGRVEAVRRLAGFNDDRAREALVGAIYDPWDTAVTWAAVEAMVESEDARFIEPLVEAMLGGRPELSDEKASEVAEEVFHCLYSLQPTSLLAREALRREAELNTDPGPGPISLEEIQERHRRWLESSGWRPSR